jgi:hypothetical protein
MSREKDKKRKGQCQNVLMKYIFILIEHLRMPMDAELWTHLVRVQLNRLRVFKRHKREASQNKG